MRFSPRSEREPCVVSLAVAQRAVQHGDLVAEHGAEAIDRLRRERDLRHEHDRRLPLLEHDAPQQLDVDERLSAARHAVQQEHVARRRRAASAAIARRCGCRRLRVEPAAASRDSRTGRAPRLRRRPSTSPRVDEPSQHRRRELRAAREMLDRGAPAERLEQLEQRALLRRAREDAVAVRCSDGSSRSIVATRRVRLRRRRRVVRRQRRRQRASNRRRRAERRSTRRSTCRARAFASPSTGDASGRPATRFGVTPSARLGRANDDADLAPAVKGNDNAHARPRALSVRVVDLVREIAEERKREGDGDEHGRKLPHRPSSGHRWPIERRRLKVHGQAHRKRRAHAELAFDAHVAAKLVREFARDAESEPRSAVRSRASTDRAGGSPPRSRPSPPA